MTLMMKTASIITLVPHHSRKLPQISETSEDDMSEDAAGCEDDAMQQDVSAMRSASAPSSTPSSPNPALPAQQPAIPNSQNPRVSPPLREAAQEQEINKVEKVEDSKGILEKPHSSSHSSSQLGPSAQTRRPTLLYVAVADRPPIHTAVASQKIWQNSSNWVTSVYLKQRPCKEKLTTLW